MTTNKPMKGTIIEAANHFLERGVYERNGDRFIYTLDGSGQFCFCLGRSSPDIDAAWEMGYREEIKYGYYQS
jgi:hypothetical protein